MAYRMAILCVLMFAQDSWAYSAGAPADACVDMTPQHGVPPQNTPAPYKVLVNNNIITGQETVEITIKGETAANTVKGFLVQARVGDKPVGTFDVSETPEYAQVLNCGDGHGNTVTHMKHEGLEDRQIIVLKWRPNPGFEGIVKFRATIVLNGGEFWVGLLSEEVLVKA